MGRTFEALERAEKERIRKTPEQPLVPVTHISPPVPLRRPLREPMDCYEALRVNLKARNIGKPIQMILFSGTTHGNGTSTTAINFASTLARNRLKKVLLIESNMRTPGIHTAFNIDQQYGLTDIMSNGNKPDIFIKKTSSENLFVVTAGSRSTEIVSLFDSDHFNHFLESVREAFDYIILDGPPTTLFSETRVICNRVDGVVLVLEAGKTRDQVALRAKNELEEAGANILGVVLNKRKHYIPEWLYKRL